MVATLIFMIATLTLMIAASHATLTLRCPTWLAWRFDCLAMTLELPFKDNAEFPIPETAWSGPRSVAFGKGVIEPMLRTLPHLRAV